MILKNRFLAVIPVLMLLASTWLAALEPPTPEQIARYRADGTLAQRIAAARALGNHQVAPRLVERARYKLERLQKGGAAGDEPMAPPLGWRGMPTTGTVRVLALLIAFQDMAPSTEASRIQDQLFGDGVGGFPLESLHSYYHRSSYGQLDIQGNVLGWYTTPYPRSGVVQTDVGRENLIREALTHYDTLGHDFSQYDNDGDGTIDYLVVVWTGPHGAWASFWWGYMTNYANSGFVLDGKVLDTYSWQWEASTVGDLFMPNVVIHETGHALGLPDYYDYDDGVGPRGGVGGLDMMDGNQGDHNPFSKWLLDWITPTVLGGGSHAVSLGGTAATGDALVIMPGATAGDPFFEFFLVQNRHRTDNDARLAANGMLIWHVDARLDPYGYNFIYDNSYSDHKLLRLMEADGLEEIEQGGTADSGDYFTAGMAFGPATVPDSDRYDGVPTNMAVTDISAPGATMTYNVEFDNQAPTLGGITICANASETIIGWETSEYAEAGLIYGRDLDLTGEAFSMSAGTVHSVALPGLQPGGLYMFQVFCADPSGNVGESDYHHFIVPDSAGVEEQVFQDDLESGAPDWTRVPNGQGPWSLVESQYARSATHAWFSTDPEGGKDDLLLLPELNLAGAASATLTFWHTYSFETGYDGGVVEVSVDGGQTFTDLGPDILAGGYTGLIDPQTQSAIKGRQAWTGGALGTMTPVTVRLDRFCGRPALVRFRLGCDLYAGGQGWYIDDVAVSRVTCEPVTPVAGWPEATGDLNGDELLDAGDLLLMADYLAGNVLNVPAGIFAGDMNGDHHITVADGVILIGRVIGIM